MSKISHNINKEGLHIRLYSNNINGSIEMVMLRDINGKREIAKPMEIEWTPLAPTDSALPTLTLPFDLGEKFIDAFGEMLERENRKVEKDYEYLGELKATKRHLKDLQILLGKNNNTLLGDY